MPGSGDSQRLIRCVHNLLGTNLMLHYSCCFTCTPHKWSGVSPHAVASRVCITLPVKHFGFSTLWLQTCRCEAALQPPLPAASLGGRAGMHASAAAYLVDISRVAHGMLAGP
jgi:hypothetical protein